MEDSAPAARPTTHHVGFREFPFVTLNAQEALFVGKGLKYSSIHPNASWIQNWTSTAAWPAWEIEVVEAGDYEVSLRYACAEDAVGTKLEISMGEAVLQGTITEAFDPEPYAHHDRVKRSESYDKPFKVMKLGTLRLKKGAGTISVKALTKPGERVMDLRALYLERK
jgi:hypothetical protein